MTNKKRVVHVIQSLAHGGCENTLLRTLPLLADFDHTIITLKDLGILAPQFSLLGIRVECVRQKNLLDRKSYQELERIIKKENPDIIFTYLFHADVVGRFFLQKKFSVAVIPFLRTTYNHSRYWIARIFEFCTKGLVTQYLANSEAVKDFYTQKLGVSPQKITVIPNGIDTHKFDNLPNPLEKRRALGFRENDMLIICVANLHKNKGHSYLLEAFDSIYLSFPHAQLLLVGEGEERISLTRHKNRLRSEKNIHLLGQRDDVPELLSCSQIFVLPTLFEGMSNALLEAMACGLATITTEIPENQAFIQTRENGILVPPKNISLLAQAIEELLRDTALRLQLGQHAKEIIKSSFSLEASTKRWREFLIAHS